MFDPVVTEILRYHQARAGNTLMGRAAERASQLGYRLVPPGGSGQARYLRLVLDGTPVTLYLDGCRLTAAAKPLQDFARSLPAAVPTQRDVHFPLGGVEIDVLEAFADWAHAPAHGPRHPQPPVRRGKPRPPWENPSPGIALPPPAVAAQGHGPALVPAGSPRPALLVAAGAALLLVLLGALAGGLGGALVMGGLSVVAVGVIALVKGSATWAHIASRGVGGAVVAGGLAVLLAGGALTSPPTEPAAQPRTVPPAPSTTAAGPSSPSEADIAAAEASLADLEYLETSHAAVDPATGLLSDEASQAAIEAADRASALAALAVVPVRGRAPSTGYDRDLFGGGWVDTDHNGCDTRNDILARDLTRETFRSGTHDCVVLTGTLADPYSGRTISFQRGQGTSDDVQIDHVVALSDAWQKGAQGWDSGRRTAFANDPLNLLAVDGPLNQQKGDGDAATWLPPNRAYRCAYVARQVAVKATYGLWMTQAEKNAIATVLGACPNQPLPAGVVVHLPDPPPTPAPAPAPVPAPAPAPPPPPAPAPPASVYYKNCDAARAAGAAPVHRGDPGYAPHLDRDGDGIGCE